MLGMSKKVKVVIDSIVEDRIRLILTAEDDEKKIVDIDTPYLKKILKRRKILEGRSYFLTFKEDSDYFALTERPELKFKPKGKVDVKDTTQSDKEDIRRLQKKLGLKVR